MGLAAVVLAACLGQTQGTRDAPTSVTVTNSAVRIGGPPGFCVDERVSRNSAQSAFVLLASCAAISNQALMPQPDVPVVLTASVAQGGAASAEDIDRFFRSEAGLTRLARSDRAERVRTQLQDGAVFVYTEGPDGADWRGIIPLAPNVIVTVALREVGATPVHADTRLATLDEFADHLIRLNAARAVTARAN